MDTFLFDLVSNVDHLVMDYTNNDNLSIRILKDIPRCKKKKK